MIAAFLVAWWRWLREPRCQERREAYLDAVRKGYVQDYEPLTAFFVEALERRLRKRRPG
jgi:hypothetical protein